MDKQKGLAPILIVLLLALGIGGYLIYQKQTKPVSISQPSPSPVTSDETTIWKAFSNANYTFQYPADWIVKNFDYLNTTQVLNQSGSIQINISEGQYPYGFENPDTKFDNYDLTFNVAGKNYQVKETTVNNKAIFVDFQIGTSKYNILFGTGYPAGEDELAAISDYNSMRNIILKILSTFKFTQ